MTGVGPLDLAAPVQAVAVILDAHQVTVSSMDSYRTWSFDSASAVTLEVYVGGADDIDQVADLLALSGSARRFGRSHYIREGEWRPGVFVRILVPIHQSLTWGGSRSRSPVKQL